MIWVLCKGMDLFFISTCVGVSFVPSLYFEFSSCECLFRVTPLMLVILIVSLAGSAASDFWDSPPIPFLVLTPTDD